MRKSLDLTSQKFDFLFVIKLHEIKTFYDKNRNRYINYDNLRQNPHQCGNKNEQNTPSAHIKISVVIQNR